MTRTLDVEGLPEERIEYLKELIELWKGQRPADTETAVHTPSGKRKVHPDEFIVKPSRVIEGTMTRGMAYDD